MAGFQGKESPKTIKNRLNFPFINNKMLNNSFFPPWTDYLPHIPGILMSIRFFWHMSLEWASKFLLWSFMDGVISVLFSIALSFLPGIVILMPGACCDLLDFELDWIELGCCCSCCRSCCWSCCSHYRSYRTEIKKESVVKKFSCYKKNVSLVCRSNICRHGCEVC